MLYFEQYLLTYLLTSTLRYPGRAPRFYTPLQTTSNSAAKEATLRLGALCAICAPRGVRVNGYG